MNENEIDRCKNLFYQIKNSITSLIFQKIRILESCFQETYEDEFYESHIPWQPRLLLCHNLEQSTHYQVYIFIRRTQGKNLPWCPTSNDKVNSWNKNKHIHIRACTTTYEIIFDTSTFFIKDALDSTRSTGYIYKNDIRANTQWWCYQ